MDESQHLARNVSGIGIFIRAEAHPQVGRLADVEQPVGVAEHEIDARTPRNRLEKIRAEPREQRLGMFEQSKLSLRHFRLNNDSRRTTQRFPAGVPEFWRTRGMAFDWNC